MFQSKDKSKPKPKGKSNPSAQALDGLKLGYHSTQEPPKAKVQSPIDPTIGLKYEEKAQHVAALAKLVAMLGGVSS